MFPGYIDIFKLPFINCLCNTVFYIQILGQTSSKNRNRKRRKNRKNTFSNKTIRPLRNSLSVQGVKSHGGHFACLYIPGVWSLRSKKNIIFHFSKRKGKYFSLLMILYSEWSSKRAK